jgi:hypothetical protein
MIWTSKLDLLFFHNSFLIFSLLLLSFDDSPVVRVDETSFRAAESRQAKLQRPIN